MPSAVNRGDKSPLILPAAINPTQARHTRLAFRISAARRVPRATSSSHIKPKIVIHGGLDFRVT